jgi:hypothetical protein
MGIQGFGLSNVSGRRRVPSPPHIIHTFIAQNWVLDRFKYSAILFSDKGINPCDEVFGFFHPCGIPKAKNDWIGKFSFVFSDHLSGVLYLALETNDYSR